MITCGIDPGSGRIGWAILKKTTSDTPSLHAYGVIEIQAHTALPDRLLQINVAIESMLRTYKPQHVCIEELFFTKNITTGIAVAHARGVIILACHKAKIPITSYGPKTIKQTITGFGNAPKNQVQRMVELLFTKGKHITPDDAADAIAIAYTHIQHDRVAKRVHL